MTPLLLLLTFPANAIDAPCYGFTEADPIESEHFWVEWEPGVATVEQANKRLDYAEKARQTFIDHGWPITDEPVLISIVGSAVQAGRTETRKCDDRYVPIIHLFSTRKEDGSGYNIPGEGTTSHEVAHAVQYAYMGDHRDSVASWLWWMEGSATALTFEADGDLQNVARRGQSFLNNPHLALHQNVTAFLFPDRSAHMYGTAIFVRFIEHNYGGPETLRALWRYGAQHTGEVIWFPDAMAAVDLDFSEVWQHFMAMSAVVDVEEGHLLDPPPAVHVRALDVATAVGAETGPQGLGLSYVHFPWNQGQRGRSLRVDFQGEADVDWYVVLVRTDGSGSGSQVLDYVPLDVVDGSATGWISGFDGSTTGFVVASPIADDAVGHAFSVTGSLQADEGPMPGRIVLVEHEERASCGCQSSTGSVAWLGLLPLLLLRRRAATRS